MKKVLIAVFLLMAISVGALMMNPPANNSATDSGKPKIGLVIASCQVAWEQINLKRMHNPNSLEWDHRNATVVAVKQGKKDKPAIAVPYRSTNSFGATVLNTAVCEVDESHKVVSVIR